MTSGDTTAAQPPTAELPFEIGMLSELARRCRGNATSIGAIPPSPDTVRARIGAILIRFVRRLLFWYTPQIASQNLLVAETLGENVQVLRKLFAHISALDRRWTDATARLQEVESRGGELERIQKELEQQLRQEFAERVEPTERRQAELEERIRAIEVRRTSNSSARSLQLTGDAIPISSAGRNGFVLLISCVGDENGESGGLCLFDGIEVKTIDRISSTGLCVFDGGLARLLQTPFFSGGGELAIYDEGGISRYFRIDELWDAHSITWDGSQFIVASTGKNAFLWINPAGEVTRRWHAPGEHDSRHLNEAFQADGCLYGCAFSRSQEYRGFKQDIAQGGGSVFDLESGRELIQGLSAPHNPRFADGLWTICDSGAGRLRQFDGGGREVRHAQLRSFPRGLALTDDFWVVGESVRRDAQQKEGTGSLAILRRSDLSFVTRVHLPFREVFDVVVAPVQLAEGAVAGFRTNALRVAEDDQLFLFRRLGMEPRRLWAVSEPLEPSQCRIGISAEVPRQWRPRQQRLVRCTLENFGEAFLCSEQPHPVYLSYKWIESFSQLPVGEGRRTRLPRMLPPGDLIQSFIEVQAPDIEGQFELVMTAVQENVCWFDSIDPANASRAIVVVRSESALLQNSAHPARPSADAHHH